MKIPQNPINKAADAYVLYKNRKTIWQMFKAVRSGTFKLNALTYIIMVLGFIYTIVPTDLLPDFIPFLGWVDDGVLIFLVIQQLKKELNKYNKKLTKEKTWIIYDQNKTSNK